MARVVQRSFASGELAPEFWGQQDQDFYRSGAKTLRNVVVTKEGSLRKRSGLEYVAALDGLRLVRFGASDGADFIVVFAASGIRIFRDGLEQAVNPPAWAAGLYPPYSFVTHNGATYSNYGTWTETKPGAETTDWDTEARPQFPGWATEPQAVQLGDVLTLTLKGHEPFQVVRGTSGWTFGAAAFAAPLKSISDFVATTSSNIAISPTDAGTLEDDWHYARDWEWRVTAVYQEGGMWRETLDYATVSLTCAMTPDYRPRRLAIYNTGTSDRIYRIYRGYNGLFGLVGEVVGATSSYSLFWDRGENPDTTRQPPSQLGAAALYEAATGAPYDETALKPNALAYWNQRAVIGGFAKGPATMLVGGLDALLDFTANPMLEPSDTDGAELALACREQEEIRAFVPADDLLVFTSRGEWAVSAQGTVTPRTLSAKRLSARGLGRVRPLMVGGHVLFVSRAGAVYALALDGQSGKWVDRDLTALASHLFVGKQIVSWAYQQRPDGIVWCALDDGTLLSLTYRPEAGVMAWAQHDVGGDALSVEVADDGDFDAVYCLVGRTGTGIFLERMRDVAAPATVQDGFYLDAARTWPDPWGATPGIPSDGSYLPLGSGIEMTAVGGAGQNYGLRIYGYAPQALTLEATVTVGGAAGTAQLRWKVNGTYYPAAVYRGGLQLLSDFAQTEGVRGLTVQHLPGPETDPTDFVQGDVFTQTIAAPGYVNEQPNDFDKVQIPAAFAGSVVDVFETVAFRKAVAVDAGGGFALTETFSERVAYGQGFTAVVELLTPVDNKGSPALELLGITSRCETAGHPALLAEAADTSGGQPEVAVTLAEYTGATDLSRRTVDGTVHHALEGEVAGAIVQTYPYPLRIFWVARDIEFQQTL